jgi:cytidylate kinase
MHIITISRGSLSAAENLAEHLSKELNTPVISREQIIVEAEKYGIKETGLVDFSFVDRAPGVWDKSSFRVKHYLLCFLTAFLDIAVQGSLIYVGHLANILLGGVPFSFRIRVVQPVEHRVKILMEESQIDREQALNHITLIDERRKKWSEFLYGINLEEPLLYDLVINLEKMDFNTAVKIVTSSVSQPEFQSTSESLQILKNFHLATKAKLYLYFSPLTRGSELEVEADSVTGSVIVKGICPYVDDDRCEQKIKSVLSKAEGVGSVKFIKTNIG